MINISKRIDILQIISQIFFSFIFVAVLFSSFGVKISFGAVECKVDEKAGETEYCLLEPIFTEQKGKGVTLSSYLGKIYQAFFITAGLLATLMLILGGFQYMISESGGSKSKATEQMRNAVWGLLLALSSYLILYTINPDLLKGSFKLTPIPIQTGTGGVVEGGDTADLPTTEGAEWPDDSVIRNQLKRYGIDINRDNCKTVGQQEPRCTSVASLGFGAVTGLERLQESCKCKILITGGTEYWFHSSHGVNKPIVDIDDLGGVNSYIEKTGTNITGKDKTCGYANVPKYSLNGAIYTRESNHWHVCY